ncbi:MAG: T9SS type A sorting domain-containing protein [Ignavibacteria bacterium]|nr:T9SS type A sorting domain-containing protein [Ignavibacteria bacterium]
MKFLILKIYFIFIIFFYSLSLNAQIVLTSANNPAVGDAHILRNVDEGEIIPGPAGANQFWDFSYIKAAQDSTATFFILKCTTPYGMHFDKANLASHDGNWHFKYYNVTESFFQYHGSGDTSKVVVYSDPVLTLQYPFTYGNSFLDSSYAIINLGQKLIKKSGIKLVIADGYGVIAFPNDTVYNVLRLKSTEIITDSIFIDGNFVSAEQIIDTSYYWYRSNYKFPIFVINFTYSESGFNRYAGFVQNPNAVGIQALQTEMPNKIILHQNYPNPFNPITNIKFDLPNGDFVKLAVYNLLGQEISTLLNEFLKAGSYNITFNGYDLPSGIYFYKIITSDFSDTKRMILIK